MKKKIPLITLVILTGAFSLHASTKAQEQEYMQARKIAMKDARVQAAFEKANEKLDERIVEIDPSLKPYVEKRKSAGTKTAKQAAPTPVKHTAPAKKPAAATTHVVAKGESLSTIAAHYKVSTARLKSANNITDERKLRVGQKLVIPTAKTAAPKKSEPQPGFWDKIKSSLD